MPEPHRKMATTPEPCQITAVAKISPRFFFFLWGGGYNTQAPADSELGPRWRKRIASMLDHPLMSVRTADIPVVSMLTSPAGIPLSTTLPVMAVAILSMWASHCPRVCSRCLSCPRVCSRGLSCSQVCCRTS